MQAYRSSKTAEQMALSRAIETLRAPGDRICDDPYARQFLGPAYHLPLLHAALRAATVRAIESRFSGHHHYVVARTRHFDEVLAAQLDAGIAQLVILGAGFDSRAHRYAGRLRDIPVFEVDHPATSAVKQGRVRGMPEARGAVRYVPVDFNVDDLGSRLSAAGYRRDLRSLFLWEGVTPYLSPAAVDETLAFVRGNSAAGSVILFDYVLRSLVDGGCEMPGARNEFERMRRTAEPLVFGIDAEAIAPFLEARGFREVIDAGSEDFMRRYFGQRPGQYIKPWWRIVQARVA